VILRRLILNDIIIHIKFLKDILIFLKFYDIFTSQILTIMSFNFLFDIIMKMKQSSFNTLLILFIHHRIFEQHNNVTMCDCITSLNKFNNLKHSMISSF